MSTLQNCWIGRLTAADGQYVDCSTHPAFNYVPGFNGFTVHVWISTVDTSGLDMLAVARGNSVVIQYGVGVRNSSVVVCIGGERFEIDPGVVMNDGAWHLVVVSFGESSFRLVVDDAYNAIHPFSGALQAATSLLLGARRDTGNSGSGLNWDGYLDEVGIWRRVLAENECLALFNGGLGLMLNEDSGDYVGSDDLDGWWRFGDGSTEHPASAPNVLIADESGNGRNGTVSGDTLDIADFYVSAELATVPGETYCVVISSSSAIVPEPTGPHFRVDRYDQGNIRGEVGYEGTIHRMVIQCEATEGVDPKIFVYERGRPIPGVSLRNRVFRRVASLADMMRIPADEPLSQFPFAFRTAQAELYARSPDELNQAWLIVQQQCATLGLDIREFGLPMGNRLRGGQGSAAYADSAVFGVVLPVESSSAEPIPPEVDSSSSSVAADPYEFSATIVLTSEADAAMRLTDGETLTLYNDLGIIRFGRDNETKFWDTFIRMPCDVPACALIEQAQLVIPAKTYEAGEDVILKIHAIYANTDLDPVGPFSSTDDPAVTRDTYSLPGYPSGDTHVFDVSDIVQRFVDRANYTPGDYLGIWIQEFLSDNGARRDGTTTPGDVYIVVLGRTDRECPSLSSSSSAGAP